MDSGEYLFQTEGVHLCGHRGHSIGGFENCVSSIREAGRLGASLCEIDVRLTADEEFVVFHDAILDFASTSVGPVRNKTLKDLKTVRHRRRSHDDGSASNAPGEALSSLEEIIEVAYRSKVGLVIEVKERYLSCPQMDRLFDIIRGTPIWGYWLLSSFDHQFLRQQKERCPDISTFGIFHSRNADVVAVAKASLIDVYSVDYPRFFEEDAQLLTEAGLLVATFLPKPLTFELGADLHAQGLAETIHSACSRTVKIIGTDDVAWGSRLLDENGIKIARPPI